MAGKKKTPSGYIKTQAQKEYESYVEHPRFGRYPHLTGQNPQTDWGRAVNLHWRSKPESRIPNTAITADVSRQSPALYPATHYYDEKCVCRDCNRPFIFFAKEQKHWYEELRFPLDADCVRCADCRKKTQWIERKKKRYDKLFHKVDRTTDETLEMADCCLSLIEEGIFTMKQEKQVRTLMKQVKVKHTRHTNLLDRLQALKTSEESETK